MQKKLELRPKDEMQKAHKLQLFDYLISVIVMRLDLRRLLIPLLQMLEFQTRYRTFNHNLIRLFYLVAQLVLREKFNLMRNNEKLLEL